MKKRLLNVFAVTVLCTALAIAALLTGGSDCLTEEQMDGLMEQYIRQDSICESPELKYLPGCQIASCKLFGMEQEGDYVYIYADVLEETYVLFEGRAYAQSGSHMPVKIKAKSEDGDLKLADVRCPEDGEGYPDSIKKMFPGRYFWRYEYYYVDNYERLYAELSDSQEMKLKKLWGEDAALERDNMLDIEEDGSYRLWTAEDGPAEEFDIEVIKEGHLIANAGECTEK